ncbi:hypothetical protein H1D32_04665 [Anaerobacillus sp. CMMVII]|uniref:hypothetical protein n=1 Tax=Anaerobacillus sp. CMMVII TaxID=2755588 RepID=UPI0021B78BDA|nr:hypothetical protein [Anaerobacillus sp. CMMVII]MCT8137092.1 hypothetical protein [Anaerobacillus sp. CMMVII]
MFGVNYIEHTLTSENFKLAHNNEAAPIYVASYDYSGVVRATHDLQADIQRVTTVIPTITHEIYTLNRGIVVKSRRLVLCDPLS